MATKQQIPVVAARLTEFQDEFSVLPTGDAQWVIMNAKDAISLFVNAVVNRAKPSILRLISNGQTLTIKSLDGQRLIYNSKKIFNSFIDSNFINWNLDKTGVATPETPMQVHEMIGNGTFMDIFSSMPGNWNQKWVSQDQIIDFCETLPDWLRQDEYATMFLVKKDENKPVDEANPQDNLVVVSVVVDSDGLSVGVRRLERDNVWIGEARPRVVSPQLIPLVS